KHPGATLLNDKGLREYMRAYFDWYTLGFEAGRAVIRAAEEERELRKKEGKSGEVEVDEVLGLHDRPYDPWPFAVHHAEQEIAAPSWATSRKIRTLLQKQAGFARMVGDIAAHAVPATHHAQDQLFRRYLHASLEFSFEWWDTPCLTEARSASSFDPVYAKAL